MALDDLFARRVPNYPDGVLARANRTHDYAELHGFLGGHTQTEVLLPKWPPKAEQDSAANPVEPKSRDLAQPEPSLERTSTARQRLRRKARRNLLAALVIVLLLGVGSVFWYNVRPITLDGEVTCATGAPVTGVWITYVDGLNWGDFTEPPVRIGVSNRYAFTARTPVLSTWSARVGCGGTTRVWALRLRSQPFSANPVHLLCDDSDAEDPRGTCVEVP